MALCSKPLCENPSRKRGLCHKHYNWQMRHGGFSDKLKATTAEIDAFLDHALNYNRDNCLQWPFARSSDGRGSMKVNGRLVGVSHWVCEKMHGPPPTSRHEAAHNCGKGHEGCINPSHLEWKTHRDNEYDKVEHGTVRGKHYNGISASDIPEFMRLYNTGIIQTELARKYDVSPRTISRTVLRYKHLQTKHKGVAYHGH